MCEALLVSRSGYYDWRRQRPGPRQVANLQLRQRIRLEFARRRDTYGRPRRARQRSKFRVATTDSRPDGPIAPNRSRELKADRPDQLWVTDATCVLTGEGWLYVVAVLDACTRRVLGWAMGSILDAPMTIAAFRMALSRRRPAPGLIVHSDRGTQFASAAYRQVLADHGRLASMSRKGNCYDHAFIESFWSSLKYETVYHRKFAPRAEARTARFDYITIVRDPTHSRSVIARSPAVQDDEAIQLDRRGALRAPRDDKTPFVAEAYDGVLVDAPCSGSGTWRRQPHLKWYVKPETIAAFTMTQREILAANAPRVKPGGRLIYATCSLSHHENQDTVAAFLKDHPNVQRRETRAESQRHLRRPRHAAPARDPQH